MEVWIYVFFTAVTMGVGTYHVHLSDDPQWKQLLCGGVCYAIGIFALNRLQLESGVEALMIFIGHLFVAMGLDFWFRRWPLLRNGRGE